MADLATDARRVMLDLDVTGLLRLWPALFPAYPRPASVDAAMKVLHMARSGTKAMPLPLRQYSHEWLDAHGLPSALPDKDRPPKKVSAVGIAVRSQYPEVASAIQRTMEYAVLDAYANGDKEPCIVRSRMFEARARERRALGLPAV